MVDAGDAGLKRDERRNARKDERVASAGISSARWISRPLLSIPMTSARDLFAERMAAKAQSGDR